MMEHSFTIILVIRGYHVYNDGWDTPIGKVFYYEQENRNSSDRCAVTVKSATFRSALLI